MTKTLTPEVEQAIFAIRSALEDRATGFGMAAELSNSAFRGYVTVLTARYYDALEAKEKPDA